MSAAREKKKQQDVLMVVEELTENIRKFLM